MRLRLTYILYKIFRIEITGLSDDFGFCTRSQGVGGGVVTRDILRRTTARIPTTEYERLLDL